MTHYDIALVGSGSVNSFPGPDLAGRSIVQIDRGVGPDRVFGGTCLNLGCIPTKMFVHTADLARTPAESSRFGVDEKLETVRWPDIRDRIFGRIDPISQGGEEYRRDHEDNANLTLLRGTARFTAARTLSVELTDGSVEEVTADVIVLGAGSRPTIPPIDGLADAAPHTSDTIMRVEQLPSSLIILGSGVVAVEMAHVLSSLGVEVTLVARSSRVLRRADRDVSARLTEILGERIRLETELETTQVRRTAVGIELHGHRSTSPGRGEDVVLKAEEILVATGRRPNSDLLDVEQAGIAVDDAGRVRVDAHQRVLGSRTSGGGEAAPRIAADGSDPAADAGSTVLDGIWALGDISSPHQLKHVANHELRIVRHNVLHPESLRRSDTMPVPHGVFTHPQVAWVGLTERAARERAAVEGFDVAVAVQEYASIAYGWAMEDTTGFAKLIVDAESTRILGAHIVGPEATTLIQLLIQAMSTGQTARDIARTQYWIHPAMPELIENALLQVAG